jgi:hypothetical protein
MPAPPNPVADNILGGLNTMDGKVVSIPTHQEINEKVILDVEGTDDSSDRKDGAVTKDGEVNEDDPPVDHSDGTGGPSIIIKTGHDAAEYLLPLRDDHDPAFTFRGIFLATILSAFQAVVQQIYNVSEYASMCRLQWSTRSWPLLNVNIS